MRIEVLYFDGCHNHEELLPRLRELLADGGIPDTPPSHPWMTPDTEAR